jgi:peroxiredoxin
MEPLLPQCAPKLREFRLGLRSFENESIAEMARSADAQEGIAAFLAKRPLQFSGR